MDELENPGGGAQQYLGQNLSICQKWVYINKKNSDIIASKLDASLCKNGHFLFLRKSQQIRKIICNFFRKKYAFFFRFDL